MKYLFKSVFLSFLVLIFSISNASAISMNWAISEGHDGQPLIKITQTTSSGDEQVIGNLMYRTITGTLEIILWGDEEHLGIRNNGLAQFIERSSEASTIDYVIDPIWEDPFADILDREIAAESMIARPTNTQQVDIVLNWVRDHYVRFVNPDETNPQAYQQIFTIFREIILSNGRLQTPTSNATTVAEELNPIVYHEFTQVPTESFSSSSSQSTF